MNILANIKDILMIFYLISMHQILFFPIVLLNKMSSDKSVIFTVQSNFTVQSSSGA